MAITTTNDSGAATARYRTQRDPDAVDTDHPLEAELAPVEGEHAGVTGGLTDEHRAAEETRTADAPVVGAHTDYTYNPVMDHENHEADTGKLGEKEPPRHDKYADENTSDPAPQRLVPSTPTNANPSFAEHVEEAPAPEEEAAEAPVEEKAEEAAAVEEMPAKNASTEDWRDYAVSQGWERVEADEWGRDELRDHFIGS